MRYYWIHLGYFLHQPVTCQSGQKVSALRFIIPHSWWGLDIAATLLKPPETLNRKLQLRTESVAGMLDCVKMVSCVIMHIPASCEVFRTGSGACNYKSSRVLQGTVCCCSAKGVIVPPMLIYPRLRVKQELLDRAPTGSIVGGSKNNWTNSDIFQKVVGTLPAVCASKSTRWESLDHHGRSFQPHKKHQRYQQSSRIKCCPLDTSFALQPSDAGSWSCMVSEWVSEWVWVSSFLTAHQHN